MTYRAEPYAGSWAVIVNGIVVFAGLTECRAKSMAKEFQMAADEREREEEA